jgi:hypothetical protein
MKSHFIKTMADHSLVKKEIDGIFAEIIPGEFPLDGLPDCLRRLVDHYADCYGFPESATVLTALTVLSAAVGPMAQVVDACEYGPTPLNIWTVIIAGRSSGKSQLVKAIGKTLFDFNRKMQSMEKSWRDQIESKLKSLRTEIPRKRGPGTIDDEVEAVDTQRRIRRLQEIRTIRPVIGTASGEALKKVVAETPDHFTSAICAEGQELLSIMFGKYNDGEQKTELDVWLALKSGDFLSDIRIKRDPVTVHGGLISMLLMVQSSVAEKLIKSAEALDRGLFTRMYFFDPNFVRRKSQRKIQKSAVQDEFDALLLEYLNLRMQVAEPDFSGSEEPEKIIERNLARLINNIKCDDDARAVFADFNDEAFALEKKLVASFPELDGELGRWREDAIQIVGLLAICKRGKSIDVPLAKYTCCVIDWCKKSFIMFFLKNHRAKIAKKLQRIEDLLAEASTDRVPMWRLRQYYGIDDETLQEIMQIYPKQLVIERGKTTVKGGRPPSFLRMLPAEEN